jgi:hypothetical protein
VFYGQTTWQQRPLAHGDHLSQSMSPAEQNYSAGDHETLAIVVSCRHCRRYLEGHHSLHRFMTTKSLTGQQARWWGTLSCCDINIVNRVGKKNPADAPSHRPDYARAPEGLCAASVLMAHCNTVFCLRQLYAAAIQEN